MKTFTSGDSAGSIAVIPFTLTVNCTIPLAGRRWARRQ